MKNNMPYMVLDITKKPGDPNAVKTGDMLLAENERLRKALSGCETVLAEIEDIIADMRGFKRYSASDSSDCRYVAYYLYQTFADRLEAAIKRKRAKIGADALAVDGIVEAAHRRERIDVAKLREALEAIISGYENADLCDMNYGEWCHDPANVCVNVPLCKAIHEARAALAAPPRNCERFQTVKQAKEAYRAEVRRVYIWDGCETERLVDWLLAPAMKQKGETK